MCGKHSLKRPNEVVEYLIVLAVFSLEMVAGALVTERRPLTPILVERADFKWTDLDHFRAQPILFHAHTELRLIERTRA